MRRELPDGELGERPDNQQSRSQDTVHTNSASAKQAQEPWSKSKHAAGDGAGRSQRNGSMQNESIAICKTGLQRNLLAQPVISTYFKYVVQPLEREGYNVETFLSIRDASSNSSVMKDTYQALSVRLLNLSDPPGTPASRILQQFVTVGDCYQQIEEIEKTRGQKYDWIFKVRSDHVFLSEVPIPRTLSKENVYVPWSGAMAGDVMYRCMNDHAFFCPRKLCRPYFNVLELFTSSFNQKGMAKSLPSGFDGPPNDYYELLPKNNTGVQDQWYFFARYGGRECCTSQDKPDCCGMIREVEFFYGLSRDTQPCSACDISCQYTIAECGPTNHTGRAHNAAECNEVNKQCWQIRSDWQQSKECKDKKCDIQ